MSDVQTLSIAASRKLTRSLNGYDLNNIEIILPNTMMIVHLDVDFCIKEVLVSLRHREYGRIDQFCERN